MSDKIVPHFVDGQKVYEKTDRKIENINPATGQINSVVYGANENILARAIDSSQNGFRIWRKTPAAERGRILGRAVEILRNRNDELARLEVLDTGKPLSEALEVDIHSGADAIEYFSGIAASLRGSHYDLGGSFAYTRREPLGIVAGIGAWNYPIQIACWKSAPALACGNAMIFKPSELTPTTAVELAQVYIEAGVPQGVFNVLQGAGETGKAMVESPAIAKVSLTGSVETGKKIMQSAAQTLKHLTFELGGKSPLIIFADCDLDQAVSAAMMANFYTQGEICSNGTRVFVDSSVIKPFTEKLLSRMEKMTIGDPQDLKTNIGALISREHLQKVQKYIDSGRAEGANLLYGGQFPEHLSSGEFSKGAFITPAIFGACTDDMQIAKEEIFGPVLSLFEFKDEKEVVARANDTRFGLAAGLFTKDVNRAHRVAAQLEAGICWINNYNITPVQIPFGGVKHSGFGRENSEQALEHYTQLKTVYVEGGEVECPW